MGTVVLSGKIFRIPTHLDLPSCSGPNAWESTSESFLLPTHVDLPEKNDSIGITDFRKHRQCLLLTASILQLLRQVHPDEHFAIGQDSFIYWRLTDPPRQCCKAPDWFYVPGVPPQLEGQYRRSYVLWQELISPAIVLEFLSDESSDELDRTPWQGKFWIYEQVIHATYYGLFDVESGHLDVYHLVNGRYRPVVADAHGHFPIEPLGISLGVWHGHFLNEEAPWMRWFDANGAILRTSEELLEIETRRAEAEQQRAARLAARLRELGVDPDAV